MSSKSDIKAEMAAAEEKEANKYGKPMDDPNPLPIVEPDYKEIKAAFKRNEYGDADLAVRLMKNRFCFDNTAQKAYYYNCTHWIKDTNNNFLKEMEKISDLYEKQQSYYWGKLQEAVENKALTEAKRYEKIHDAYASRVKGLRGIERVKRVWKLARSGPNSLGIEGKEWNRNPLLLPCKNCVIDLETGKQLKGSPEQYFNRSSPIEYHGLNAEAPEWDDLMEKVLCRDEALIDYFGHFTGLSATGLQTKDFFCAYGPEADNGKSVLFSIIQKVLGDFAGTLPVEVLLEEKFSRNPDAPSHTRLKMFGMRLATTEEAQTNSFFSLNKIKSFTSGGDLIEARGIQAKESVEFEQTQTLVLHTNFLPKARGMDNGFYNRLKVLPFRARFIPAHDGPEDPARNIYHQVDRTKFIAAVMKNAPGVLASFVRYAIKFIRMGDMPKPPECVIQENKNYKTEQDLIGQFLNECCEFAEGGKEQMKYIHAAFKWWSIRERGFKEKEVWSQNILGNYFKTRPELTKIESNRVYYSGLRILPDWMLTPDGQERTY